MKPLLLFVFAFAGIHSFAQKTNNIFLSTELGKTTHGLSLVYNRQLHKSNVGVGAGVEFIDIGQQKLGGIMPSFDLRYYIRAGRSAFIPLAQAGYNFYRFQYVHSNPNEAYELRGRESFSLGLGYSYRLTKNGGGPFAALKYRSLQYKLSSPTLPEKNSVDGLKISIGWRF